MGGDLYSSSGAVGYFDFIQPGRLETSVKDFCVGFGSDRDQSRLPALGLFESGIQIPPRSQSNNLEALGIRFNYTQRAAANGAGRTQDGDAFHSIRGRAPEDRCA